MSSLLSRLSGTPKSAKIEPREIFMALPKRVKGYEYPRDVQSEVWKKWFEIRNYKNCVIILECENIEQSCNSARLDKSLTTSNI